MKILIFISIFLSFAGHSSSCHWEFLDLNWKSLELEMGPGRKWTYSKTTKLNDHKNTLVGSFVDFNYYKKRNGKNKSFKRHRGVLLSNSQTSQYSMDTIVSIYDLDLNKVVNLRHQEILKSSKGLKFEAKAAQSIKLIDIVDDKIMFTLDSIAKGDQPYVLFQVFKDKAVDISNEPVGSLLFGRAKLIENDLGSYIQLTDNKGKISSFDPRRYRYEAYIFQDNEYTRQIKTSKKLNKMSGEIITIEDGRFKNHDSANLIFEKTFEEETLGNDLSDLLDAIKSDNLTPEIANQYSSREIGRAIVSNINDSLKNGIPANKLRLLKDVEYYPGGLFDDAQIHLHFREESIDGIIEYGFLNQHQTGGSISGDLDIKKRANIESKIAGIRIKTTNDPNSVFNKLKPKYALYDINKPTYVGIDNNATQYGDIVAVFNEDIKKRTTFSIGDSKNTYEERDFFQVYPAGYPSEKVIKKSNNEIYVEAAIWGEIDLRDVNYWYVHKDTSAKVIEKLTSTKIPVKKFKYQSSTDGSMRVKVPID